MKTITIGGSTITLTEKTYEKLFDGSKTKAMQEALEKRDFDTYNRLRTEVGA